MKLKENFVLRNVADTWVVLPLDAETINFNGMLTLNESGASLWNALEQGSDREELAEVLLGTYSISREQALEDIDQFLLKLKSMGVIED